MKSCSITSRMILFSAILALTAFNGIGAEEKPSLHKEPSDLIYETMVRILARGNTMQQILGRSGEVHFGPLDKSARELRTAVIRSWNIEDKTAYALLYLLLFNVDGEGQFILGEMFEDDKTAVGKRIKRIRKSDLESACEAMGFPKERAAFILRVADIWINSK